jgi:hypothetical protein
MIKRYMEHMQTKHPHHRRQHALQVAGVFTALAFVVWITTLGMRFGGASGGQVATQNGTDGQTQLAGAGATSDTSQTGLEVVATSTYSNY